MWPIRSGRGAHRSDGKAQKTGASKIYIDNLQEEFVRDFVFPALRANAIYEGTYLMGTSLARPLIAKRQIEIASAEGADAVSMAPRARETTRCDSS